MSRNNYFEIFSIAESFEIESEILNQNYKILLMEHHPDKVVNSGDQERLKALQITSILNQAYETLMSPLKRSAYLLTLHGVDPEENIQSQLGEDFLFKQLQLREDLEEIALKKSLSELQLLRANIENEISIYFEEFGKYYFKGNYLEAKLIYNRLQFLHKLLIEIEVIEDKILDY